MTYQPPLAGGRGRETLVIHVFSADQPEPRDVSAPGAQTTVIGARSLAVIRAHHGGDEFDLGNPTTGRRHHIRLQRYADHDPERTLVQFRFHYYPAPFASHEAQVLQQRAHNALRRLHELIVAITDEPQFEHAWDDAPEGSARTRDANASEVKREKHSFESFATGIGLLTQDEVAGINNEYAHKHPELFHRY